MFIQDIYKALTEGKNIILVGPRGCGKSTVMSGIYKRAGLSHVELSLQEALGSRAQVRNRTDIVSVDIVPAEADAERVKDLCSRSDAPSFVFMTSSREVIPECYQDARRFAVIEWPERA